jgi:membrane protein YqaA with SNARE-associated domain
VAAPPDAGDPAPDAPAPVLDVKRLLVQLGIGLGGLLLAAMGAAYFFRPQLLTFAGWFVDSFGGPGIAVGYFVPDAFTVPLPNDAFTTFGRLGGMGFWEVVAWGSLGSLVGGSTGYWLARTAFSRSARLRRFVEERSGELMHKIHRGGAVVLAAAALTPLPYSIACWAAGALRMPFAHFLAVSSLRVIRVAFYLWLIEAGFVSVVD